MVSSIVSTALSGLNAQKTRLAATASNIANISTAGAAPGSPAAQNGAATVYRPLTVNLTSQVLPNGQGAGVSAYVTESTDGFSLSYDPSAAGADADGNVAVPNVDLTRELTNLIETKALFKANAAVLRSEAEISGELLDILS